MPDQLKHLIDAAPAGIFALVSAVILSVLGILGDEKTGKAKRLLTETPTAGCIGYAFGMMAHEFGFGVGTVLVIGTVIGHLGTEYLKTVAKRLIEKKVK